MASKAQFYLSYLTQKFFRLAMSASNKVPLRFILDSTCP